MSRFLKQIILVASICGLSSIAGAVELTGVVKSEDGKPLAGVQIKTYAPEAGSIAFPADRTPTSTKRYEATTDSNGFFRLPSHGQLVYFHRDDLRPLTRIVDLSTKHIDVTMEDNARTLWKVPPCSPGDKSNRAGIGFMIEVPANVMVKKDEQRFQDGGYFYGYRLGEQIEAMVNWWESTSLEPEEKYLLDSKEFSQRMWISGDNRGYEFRGTLSDGKAWRRISLRNGAITYQGHSKEAAKIFDSMIDSMCFDASAVKW